MKKLLIFFLICPAALLWSQGVLRVEGNQLYTDIRSKLKPGTTVLLDRDAAIIVRGGLDIRGASDNRIIIRSENPDQPGRGLIFEAGAAAGEKVRIEKVTLKHLAEPIYFESYNQYERIDISQTSVVSSGSSGSAVSMYNMISSAFVNRTQVTFSQVLFVGNEGNVRILGIDDQLASITFDKVVFAYNNSFTRQGELLDLEAFSKSQEELILVKEMAFISNWDFSRDKPWVIGLSGVRDTLKPANLYISDKALNAVLDGRKEHFRPYMPVNRITSLPAFATGISDLPSYTLSGDALEGPIDRIETVLRTSGKAIDWQRVGDNKALLFGLLEDQEILVKLQDGRSVKLDYKSAFEEEELEEMEEEENGDSSLSLGDSLQMIVETGFAQVIVDPIWHYPKQELGFMTGISYYIGDANRFGVIPAAIDFSLGGTYQYLFDERWSIGGRYQFTRIATGFASLLPLSDPKNEHVFRNDLHSFRGDAYYSLWPRKQGKTVYGYLTGEIGMGLGLLFFDPKMRGVDMDKEGRWVRVRPFGTEGQNFLEGEGQYGYAAMEFSLNGRLRWSLGNLSLLLEGSLTVATTDYLDDMSYGYYYGGDLNRARQTSPFNNYFSDAGGEGRTAIRNAQENGVANPKITRGYNALPYAYVTFMVGFAYTID